MKFHELNNNFTVGYGNQFIHYYTTTENFTPVQNTIFVSYRARTTDIETSKGYSKQTDVESFSIVPLSKLKKETITVSYTLDFTPEENNNNYYSGIVIASNYRLVDIANDNSINYDKIYLVRLISFEGNLITKFGSGENPFSKLILGFNENVYSFDVFGDIYLGSF